MTTTASPQTDQLNILNDYQDLFDTNTDAGYCTYYRQPCIALTTGYMAVGCSLANCKHRTNNQ